MFRVSFTSPAGGAMTNLRELTIEIFNFELSIQFAMRVWRWRYCNQCHDILDDDGSCSNPHCSCCKPKQ